MKVTLHSHHTSLLLLSKEVGSTHWPDDISDTSDQFSFFGRYNAPSPRFLRSSCATCTPAFCEVWQIELRIRRNPHFILTVSIDPKFRACLAVDILTLFLAWLSLACLADFILCLGNFTFTITTDDYTMPIEDMFIRRGYVSQNTTVFVSYLLVWRHISATVGHHQGTKIPGVQLKSGPLTKPWIFHVRCYL